LAKVLIDKAIIIVFRCNGTFDEYIVGPGIKIPEGLHLGVGDTIINIIPLGLHPHPPVIPTKTNTPISTVIPTETRNPSVQPATAPYPAPVVTTTNDLGKGLPTVSPYPAP
jgi:hypothetical protein